MPEGTRPNPLTNPVIEAYLKDVDLTLIRENLKLSVEQRILKLQSYLRLVEELKSARINKIDG